MPTKPKIVGFPLRKKRVLETSASEPSSARRRRRLSAFGLNLGSFVDPRISDDYFFAEMHVGSPPQRVEMALDTGSALPYFACAETCSHCGQHSDAPFVSKKSDSFRWHKCGDSLCDKCATKKGDGKNRCQWSQRYADKSSIVAWVGSDLVSFGSERIAEKTNASVSGDSHSSRVRLTIGCSETEAKTIYRQNADGVMGLSMNPHSVPNQMGAKYFAHCFASAHSHSQITADDSTDKIMKNGIVNVSDAAFSNNGANAEHFGYLLFSDSSFRNGQSLDWAPFVGGAHHGWYRTKTVGISVGGDTQIKYTENLQKGYKGTVFDTGSSTLSFPRKTAEAIMEALHKHSGIKPQIDATKKYDWCLPKDTWNKQLPELVNKFPTIVLQMEGGVKLRVAAADYVVRKAERVCLDLFGDVPSILVGSNAMTDKWLLYDSEHSRLAIWNGADCRSQRLPPFLSAATSGSIVQKVQNSTSDRQQLEEHSLENGSSAETANWETQAANRSGFWVDVKSLPFGTGDAGVFDLLAICMTLLTVVATIIILCAVLRKIGNVMCKWNSSSGRVRYSRVATDSTA